MGTAKKAIMPRRLARQLLCAGRTAVGKSSFPSLPRDAGVADGEACSPPPSILLVLVAIVVNVVVISPTTSPVANCHLRLAVRYCTVQYVYSMQGSDKKQPTLALQNHCRPVRISMYSRAPQ